MIFACILSHLVSWIVDPWLVDASLMIIARASGHLKQIYLTFALRFHFLSFYFARALRVVQITWLPFAYMLENLFFRMRILAWNYVKRNFLARKFPSETISGAIFCCNNRIAILQGRASGHPETRSITTKSWEYRIDQGSLKESVARLWGGWAAGLITSPLGAVRDGTGFPERHRVQTGQSTRWEAARLEKPDTSKHFFYLFPCPLCAQACCWVLCIVFTGAMENPSGCT